LTANDDVNLEADENAEIGSGGWTDLFAVLGGVAWYAIALAVPLSIILAIVGGVTLARRWRRLSRLLTWVLGAGTAICAAILVLGLTPFGLALWTWWLD
jgi:hypothetical protein